MPRECNKKRHIHVQYAHFMLHVHTSRQLSLYYESHYGKKKREFCRVEIVAATTALKLSDVTFLDNQMMYHNDRNKFQTSKIGPFPFER